MNPPIETAIRTPKPFPGRILAFAGLISVLAGPVAYMLLIDQRLLRSTGLVMWVLMFDGVVLGLVAAMKDRRKSVKAIAAVNIALTTLALLGFFVLSALPETSLAALQTAPEFTLSDDAGNSVSLQNLLKSGPVLLIFYRGHW